MTITLIMIVVLVLVGILFTSGRGAFLIAGYNTLPAEKKREYDTVALCKFMGKMMFVLAFSMTLRLIGDLYQIEGLSIGGIVLFFSTIAFILLYGNTGNRFKKEK
ncbi:DUF3784 domain-containing protein [Evansella tamaricis]|uniref:DUF3784 domain-containing protein n=1 Tax=Evansella tamaricis TaxID=2069301 RepID=A0ABS6JMM3_9BACI|nr:DUF3784 domain-containing protein [Evansella tamaricis]MBU9714934.1 DUF3784 domain-containing protein [Evansella tamaricis]